MKKIVCEMCGSNDLLKKEDVFVCQCCGTKYSLEEAKKMMVEIDNTKKVSNLYERARKSLEVNDLANAAKYYSEILDENPNDWEAYFYSYLGEFSSFTNGEAASVASKLGNTIPPAYDMAVKNCEQKEAEERVLKMTNAISDRLIYIASTGESLLRQYEGGSLIGAKGSVNRNLYNNMRPMVQATIIQSVFAFDPIDEKVRDIMNHQFISNEIGIQCLLILRRSKYNIATIKFSPSSGLTEYMIKSDFINEYAAKIKELDPNFELPPIEAKSASSGGCYVATCVYGSYDCPEVWTLRRYRDKDLATTWYGRLFIKIYYAISPTIVRLFGKTIWFNNMWKPKLDKMVTKLQNKGYESTPYEDKVWK